MASVKGFVKGLATGVVLSAAASLVMMMRGKDEKSEMLRETAKDILARVSKRAVTLGSLTKSAYHNIVETTLSEYKGIKVLSEDELKELKKELKGSWSDLQKILKRKK